MAETSRRAMRRTTLGALALALVTAGVGTAWTQLWNEYPNSPQSCTGVEPYMCWEWPLTSGGLSVNENVFLNVSLNDLPYSSVDMRQDFRDAFPDWNNIAARNPHLQETTNATLANDSGTYAYGGTFSNASTYGSTSFTIAASGWRIVATDIKMNKNIGWNHNLDFGVFRTAPQYHADSRKVVRHELGHSEGLGHTGIDPAIMRQGATTYYRVQANDKSGIIAIYGAYP